jgi:hypothetical protein
MVDLDHNRKRRDPQEIGSNGSSVTVGIALTDGPQLRVLSL